MRCFLEVTTSLVVFGDSGRCKFRSRLVNSLTSRQHPNCLSQLLRSPRSGMRFEFKNQVEDVGVLLIWEITATRLLEMK